MAGGHYSAANLIILELTANQPRELILPYIQAGAQALELMILEPSLIAMLMQNERIANLIPSTGCSMTKKSIDWYKTAGRRKSWYAQINFETMTTSIFQPVQVLGNGAYGTVRLFRNSLGEEIAVKSPNKGVVNASEKKQKILKDQLLREANFNQYAYPEKTYGTFQFNTVLNNDRIYSHRYIMPYIKGETAEVFISKIRSQIELAETILAIALELQRIHDLKIIHGDVKRNNIMIRLDNNKIIVRFIDFGFSYFTTEPKATTFVSDPKLPGYIAPERLCDLSVELKPNVNQDVYSFGFDLNVLLQYHPTQKQLLQTFPSIKSFILAAQNINPLDRPSLDMFCKQLSEEIRQNKEPKIVQNDTTQTNHGIKRNPPFTIHHFWVKSQKRTTPEQTKLPKPEIM